MGAPTDRGYRHEAALDEFDEEFLGVVPFLQEGVAAGASQIRVASEVPRPGAEFPLWGMRASDTRITPDSGLDDVARIHPHLGARHVTLDTGDEGLTIRLVVGTPQPGRSGHAPDAA